MTTWFHTMILATCVIATVAVGIASAAVYKDMATPAAKKSDRLTTVADNVVRPEMTIEQRADGVSILTRVPATIAN